MPGSLPKCPVNLDLFPPTESYIALIHLAQLLFFRINHPSSLNPWTEPCFLASYYVYSCHRFCPWFSFGDAWEEPSKGADSRSYVQFLSYQLHSFHFPSLPLGQRLSWETLSHPPSKWGWWQVFIAVAPETGSWKGFSCYWVLNPAHEVPYFLGMMLSLNKERQSLSCKSTHNICNTAMDSDSGEIIWGSRIDSTAKQSFINA